MSPTSRPSVLIAGAGLAGLAAAWSLHRDGCRVTVVEARSRVGGRVWTIREGFADGQHAEAGGDLIDEGQDEIRRMVEEVGLELVPILRGGFGFVWGGEPGRNFRIEPAGQAWTKLAGLLAPYIRQYRLVERRWDSVVARAMARISVAQWLIQIGADDALHARLRGLRGFFLAEPEQLSLLALVDQMAMEAPGQGGMFRIRGGNDQLPERLAAPLGDAVRLRTSLTAVQQWPDRVIGIVREADGTEYELAADYLIVAMPATTVRRIAFEPALPAEQRQAID